LDPAIGAKANWAGGIYEVDGTTLKSGKELWCATCHDDDPAYSNPNGEPAATIIVVDDDDPECSFDPEWNHVPGGQAYGDNFLWIEPGDGSRTVTWTPDIPRTGNYNIYAWNPYNTNRGNITYTINHNTGATDVPIDQGHFETYWIFLGKFTFNAGSSGSVELHDVGDGTYINGDAMKFIYTSGTKAPNVVGGYDETLDVDYGFYVTGHNISCLNCHDAGKVHIDHEHRTFEVNEYDNYSVATPYNTSYRLKSINGAEAMVVPKPNHDPLDYWQDFALCFSCHNRYEVLVGITHTNFYEPDHTTTINIWDAHSYHLKVGNIHFDSDWDLIADSRESCIACHNVHGSPTGPMIRHGELISTPGTTDKVPALDFSYYREKDTLSTATYTATGLAGGDYEVFTWCPEDPNGKQTGDAPHTVYYDGGGPTRVTIDQRTNGNTWKSLGTYHYEPGSDGVVVIDNGHSTDYLVVADAIRWDNGAGDNVIVDNQDAAFFNTIGTWNTGTDSGNWYIYGDDIRYTDRRYIKDSSMSVVDSVAGKMHFVGVGLKESNGSKVCKACHDGGHAAYLREAKLWPKVITTPGPQPTTVDNDGTGSTTITVTILDHDDNVSGVTIDMSSIGGNASQAMTDNGDGTYSYVLNVNLGTIDEIYTFEITATDTDINTGTGTVSITVVEPGAIYMDDPAAVFDPDCTAPESYPASKPDGSPPSGDAYTEWAYWWGEDQEYGNGLRFITNTTGSAWGTATWTPNIPAAGDYKVYAWWMEHTANNRATDVPYTVYYNGGSETVRVDQTDAGPGGGKWNLLGTWNFTAGTSGQVVLSNDANHRFVIADAIKLVPVP
jgi:hypothetical protein